MTNSLRFLAEWESAGRLRECGDRRAQSQRKEAIGPLKEASITTPEAISRLGPLSRRRKLASE